MGNKQRRRTMATKTKTSAKTDKPAEAGVPAKEENGKAKALGLAVETE